MVLRKRKNDDGDHGPRSKIPKNPKDVEQTEKEKLFLLLSEDSTLTAGNSYFDP